MNGLALCAGGYGLEAGLHIVMPGVYRTVCAVERQAYPVACLVAAMENKALAPFPIWDDVATFDPLPWRGIVHIITAGYPCQPFSLAGKRLGENDHRHLWPHIRRIVLAVKPVWVFCENVAAHLTHGFPEVRADLEAIGYRVEAGIFSAAEVGAPHLRERLFFLGQLSDAERLHSKHMHEPDMLRRWPDEAEQAGLGCGAGCCQHVPNTSIGTIPPGTERGGWPEGADPDRSGAGAELADSDGSRESQQQGMLPEGGGRPGNGSSTGLVNAHRRNCNGRPDQQGREPQGRIAACRAGCELGNTYDESARAGLCQSEQGKIRIGRSGDADCERWPWPAGRGAEQYEWEAIRLVESGVGRTIDGVGARNERLYMLGNGVVPVVAALAFVALWERLNQARASD